MKKIRLFLACAAWVAVFLGSVAAAPAQKQFSADMLMQGSQGAMQSKLYVGDQKTRMEMPQAVTILRLDRGLSYMLMPEQRMYMEHPLDMSLVTQTSTNMPGETERKPLGKESVNGVSADKFQVTYNEPGKAPQSMHQWIGPNDIPIKMASLDGSWSVEYSNIQVGPQPNALFEPPADYEKFAMPNMADIQNMR